MKIGIIGLGLMGGSIAKVLSKHHAIATLYREDGDVELARQEGLIDTVFHTLADLIQNVDLCILATPLSAVIPLARKIAALSLERHRPLWVIDIGSVKREISSAFELLTCSQVEFLPTHPMAGIEQQGFEASRGDLFVEAPWIVTPHSRTTAEGLQIVENIIALLGAKTLYLDATEHDRQAALVSHLPYLIACHFLAFVQQTAPDAAAIAGPGFCSFTRIAHDAVALREEILACNGDLIEHYREVWLSSFMKKGDA